MNHYLRSLLLLLVPGVGQLLQGRGSLGWFFLSGFGLLVALGVVGYSTLWSGYLWALLGAAAAALYWASGADFGRHHARERHVEALPIIDSISIQVVRRADVAMVTPRGQG